ncbi:MULTISPECIES: GAP family protein [unclassified Mycobacterium]|uniref:GAP family protein n=1 Tax=unclassified Mycobacterium TaxID=2642494 RepID=UPI0029C77CB5|nr:MULTISPECIES: GAP family protein [unclassified Mycobacterium]
MWGPLLVLALVITINPVRLGIILLVLSRPRPMQNLLAYWFGTLLSGFTYLLVPLFLLHSTPTSASIAEGLTNSTASPLAQRITIALGVVLVAVAVLMTVRSLARPPSRGRHAVQSPHRRGGTSTQVHDPASLPIISRLMRAGDEVLPDGASRVRRLLGRARDAWRNGSPWIALVIGLMVMPADGVLLALALIVASGGAIGMQLGAGITFVITVLAVEEVILVSNLVAPEKTHAALQWLHDWALAHHRNFMAVIMAVVGASLIVQGLGVL